jgi:hypothetical protein
MEMYGAGRNFISFLKASGNIKERSFWNEIIQVAIKYEAVACDEMLRKMRA